MSYDSPQVSPVTPETLAAILDAHGRWLASKGQQGNRAELRGTDLSGVDLSGADLRHADLRKCRMEGARLQNARLNYADLSGAVHFFAEQLAGADVAGAKLPPQVDLADRLEHIEHATVNSRKVFFIMLLMAVYTWLTIATTSDVDLLTNTATSPLPIILTELPVSGFYWVAPLVLLGIYVYFHLHLQRLWEDLAALPAFFPDGRTLDDKVHPWMLTGLVNAYCLRLREVRPAISRLQNFLSIVLAWYIIPATIGALWLRYLPRHDGSGTAFHVFVLMLAAVAGVMFYHLAVSTLSGKKALQHATPASPPRRFLQRLGCRDKLFFTEASILALALIGLPLLSYGAIGAAPREPSTSLDPRMWAPRVLTALSYSPFANFKDRDVSVRPANWSDNNPPFDVIKGANLKGVDLRHASAFGAFMAKADLRDADLRGADLELANLRRARLQDVNLHSASLLQTDLRESNLEGADLRNTAAVLANLQGADLSRADLRGAFLNEADLRQTNLYMADLREAYLNEADLRGANLELAILRGANLEGADLRKVKGLQCVQLEAAVMDSHTRLPQGLNCPEALSGVYEPTP